MSSGVVSLVKQGACREHPWAGQPAVITLGLIKTMLPSEGSCGQEEKANTSSDRDSHNSDKCWLKQEAPSRSAIEGRADKSCKG